jgi:cytochrome P450
MVGYSTFLMHRRKDLFGDDVEDFNPSRWATWTPAAWTYIPFNGGPRICLGQNFALTEMAYVVSRTCQMFERIEERSGLKRGKVGFRADIILSPLNGVQIGLIPANLEK